MIDLTAWADKVIADPNSSAEMREVAFEAKHSERMNKWLNERLRFEQLIANATQQVEQAKLAILAATVAMARLEKEHKR